MWIASEKSCFILCLVPYVALNLGLFKYFFLMRKDTVKILMILFKRFIIKDSKYMHYFLVVLSI